MRPGFEPIAFWPPLWLSNDSIIVVGRQGGRATAILLSGPQWQAGQAISPGAPNQSLADLAASPDGLELAIARLDHEHLLTLSVYDLSTASGEQAVASVPDVTNVMSLAWPQADTIALEVETSQHSATPESKPAILLYLISPSGGPAPEPVPLTCALSNLNWSPNGSYAVGAGDGGALPVLIDRKNETCQVLNLPSPIRVLDWSATSTFFLYAAASAAYAAVGTFRYDIGTGRSTSVAVSSQAAAYTRSGVILALGNQRLTWQRVTEHSRVPVIAQLALIDPQVSQMQIKSLGIQTVPKMLAQSTMVYARGSDTAAIDLLGGGANAPTRSIITYSPATGRGVLLARGNPRGVVLMSWSRGGRYLAILDSNVKSTVLTVLRPNR
jgi:hypothetical protein